MTVVLLAGGAGGFAWFDRRDTALSTPPPRLIEGTTVGPAESVVAARISARYDTLALLLADLTERPLTKSGTKRWRQPFRLPRTGSVLDRLRVPTPDIEVGYRWDVVIRRAGEISVAPAIEPATGATARAGRQAIRITVPVRFDGNVGLLGGAARVLTLNRNRFGGGLDVTLDVAIELDRDWCPVVEVDATRRWRGTPRIEVIDGVFLDIAAEADSLIGDLRNRVAEKIAAAIPCERVRAAIAPHWRIHAVPLQIDESTRLYANLRPLEIATSGMVLGEEAFGVDLRLTIEGIVETEPALPSPLPLPPLGRVAGDLGRSNLLLPVVAPLDWVAERAVERLGGQGFDTGTPVGVVRATLTEMALYQSGARIVLDVGLDAEAKREIFSTTGRVQAHALPEIERDAETGQNVLTLSDLGFSRTLDNGVWRVLSVLFQGTFRDALQKELRYDPQPILDTILARVQERLAAGDLAAGVRVVLSDPALTLEDVAVADSQLMVTLGATAMLEIRLGQAFFAPRR
ncbi:MAG: DUF4403 family protein [Pseudomonadota bacterium]